MTAITPKRKRGAPAGNKNAVKHGFYATHFNPQENADFESMKPLGVFDEIQLIRALMRRVLASSATVTTHAENLETLRVISLATHALTRLIRTQLIDRISPISSSRNLQISCYSNNNFYEEEAEKEEAARMAELEEFRRTHSLPPLKSYLHLADPEDDEDDDLDNDLDLDEEQAQAQPRKTSSSPQSPAKPVPAVSLVSEIENLKKVRDILKTRSLAVPVSAGPPIH